MPSINLYNIVMMPISIQFHKYVVCAKAHLTILIMSYFRSLCPGFRGKSVFSVCDGRTSLEYFYVYLTALPLDLSSHNDLLIATSDPTYKCQCVFVIPSSPEV